MEAVRRDETDTFTAVSSISKRERSLGMVATRTPT